MSASSRLLYEIKGSSTKIQQCDVFVMGQWLAKLPSDYYSLLIVNEKWGVNVPWSWWGWSISYHYISTKLLPGCIVMIYWFHGPQIH